MTKCLEPRLVAFLQDRIELFSGPASICKHTKLGGGWNLKTPRAHVGSWVMVSSPFVENTPSPFCCEVSLLHHLFINSKPVKPDADSIRELNHALRYCCTFIAPWIWMSSHRSCVVGLVKANGTINSDCQMFQFQSSETLYQVLCW